MKIKEDINEKKLHEECGVFGVSVKKSEAAQTVYKGLLSIQHRGQEGAGIAAVRGNSIVCEKNTGLVSEVFTSSVMKNITQSKTAIGHVRYSTTGSNTASNVQPFTAEFLTGRIACAHNGNIINAKEIKERLKNLGISFTATSDSEVISCLIAYKMMMTGDEIGSIIDAVRELKGAFSLIILTKGQKLIAVRDSHGFRPLCIGDSECGMAVTSESCALDSCGFNFLRDVAPGEILVIENGEITHSDICLHAEKTGMCIFEFVYFARPDSIIDSLSVYEARYNMGKKLAAEYPADADVVCGIPDSGLEAAMGYAEKSGIPLVSGFVKNRYIGRSFIFPTQDKREKAVSLKLNPLRVNIEGRRVVIVDDSIVRGTTIAKHIRSMRDAGVKEVHVRISSPPFRYTCHFGTDIDNEDALIANQISMKEICKIIGADTLGYLSVEGLLESCAGCRIQFCTGCFTGRYNIDPAKSTKLILEKQ